MIELLLQAERALTVGLLDQAEQIYRQAIERDPQNAIAVVGLARVAVERGDDRTGYEFARGALEIDPENAVARRLAHRLAEVMTNRDEAVPEAAVVDPGPGSEAEVGVGIESEGVPEVELDAGSPGAPMPGPAGPPPVGPAGPNPVRRGLFDRLRRRG